MCKEKWSALFYSIWHMRCCFMCAARIYLHLTQITWHCSHRIVFYVNTHLSSCALLANVCDCVCAKLPTMLKKFDSHFFFYSCKSFTLQRGQHSRTLFGHEICRYFTLNFERNEMEYLQNDSHEKRPFCRFELTKWKPIAFMKLLMELTEYLCDTSYKSKPKFIYITIFPMMFITN